MQAGEKWGGNGVVVLVRRLVAFVLDWVVLFAVFVAPQLAIAWLWDHWPVTGFESGFTIWGWVVATVSIPSWVYFTASDRSRDGATIGKRVMSIAVESATSEALSTPRALLRTGVKLLPWELTHVAVFLPEPIGETLTPFKGTMLVIVNALLLVWLLVPVLDRRHRALHDLAARTAVVPSPAQAERL